MNTVWASMWSGNVQDNTFSNWTTVEKQVDAQLIVDAIDQAADDYYIGNDSVYVIVSSDLDVQPAVKKIVERGFVVLWAGLPGMVGKESTASPAGG